MNLTPSEERSIFKHPVEALLAALLLISLLFIAPDSQNDGAAKTCAARAAGCVSTR